MACDVAQPLPDFARLWRRAKDDPNHLLWDDETQRFAPATADALRFNPELSAAWGDHVESHGVGPKAVVAIAPRFGLVYEIDAAAVRHLGLTPEHKPDDPPEPPVKCAHVLISLAEGAPTDPDADELIRLRWDLATAMVLIEGRVTLRPPQGSGQSS